LTRSLRVRSHPTRPLALALARDYPTILREILEALARQNPKNWAEVRAVVVGIIREEVA
jgi:hypothetical protein